MTQAIISQMGKLFIFESCLMVVPCIIDFLLNSTQSSHAFALSSMCTMFIGVLMLLARDSNKIQISTSDIFRISMASWFGFALFGSLPIFFQISIGNNTNFASSFFEIVSSLTTTGATVIRYPERLSSGTLLWRGMMHGIGGIGIIVIHYIMLSESKTLSGVNKLLRSEVSEHYMQILPMISNVIHKIIAVYVIIISTCCISYYILGMNVIDAISYGMSTVATGGLSNHSQSIGYFNSRAIENLSMVFMIIGSMPFSLLLCIAISDYKRIFADEQIKVLFLIIGIVCIIMVAKVVFIDGRLISLHLIHSAMFATISAVSTSGFVGSGGEFWVGPNMAFCFGVVSIIGGCIGSTSGGLKIMRFVILFKTIRNYINVQVSPKTVIVNRINGISLTDKMMCDAMMIFCLFLMTLLGGTFIVVLFGNYDVSDAFGMIMSCVTNCGFGSGKFSSVNGELCLLPSWLKIFLSIIMIIGRLEFVSFYAFCTKILWSQRR